MTVVASSAGPGVGLPKRYMWRTWFIAGGILCLGVLLSKYCGDWEWLGRSGALVTITTMVFATFDADISSRLVIQYLNDYCDPSEQICNRIRTKPHLYGVQLPLEKEQEQELLQKEVTLFNERARMILKNEMAADLRKLELQIAVVGTLVWAFAGLINGLCEAPS